MAVTGLEPRGFSELVQITLGRLAGESLPKERAFATWPRDVAGELIPADRLTAPHAPRPTLSSAAAVLCFCLPAADSSGQIHCLLVRNCLESPNLSRCHSLIDRPVAHSPPLAGSAGQSLGKVAGMHRRDSFLRVAACLFLFHLAGLRARAVTEVRLDKDFLAGIVEKLPPARSRRKGYIGARFTRTGYWPSIPGAGGSWPPARSRDSSGRP